MEKTYFVYIAANCRRGTIYTGVTNDLARRMTEHRAGQPGSFTARYRLYRLVYYEIHQQVWNALEREKQIKRWKRTWKFALIEAHNPEWKDLSDDLI